MGRAPCCDKANVKKGPWSPEEDAALKSYIQHHGTGGNWIALPQKIGLKRCGKSCRLRWLNYLRPNIKHGGFSEEEDNIICSLYVTVGSRWSIIAAQLPGRTDNDIKNYWNTRLKKKLLGKHHRPPSTRNHPCAANYNPRPPPMLLDFPPPKHEEFNLGEMLVKAHAQNHGYTNHLQQVYSPPAMALNTLLLSPNSSVSIDSSSTGTGAITHPSTSPLSSSFHGGLQEMNATFPVGLGQADADDHLLHLINSLEGFEGWYGYQMGGTSMCKGATTTWESANNYDFGKAMSPHLPVGADYHHQLPPMEDPSIYMSPPQ